jgi:hypothetical protein
MTTQKVFFEKKIGLKNTMFFLCLASCWKQANKWEEKVLRLWNPFDIFLFHVDGNAWWYPLVPWRQSTIIWTWHGILIFLHNLLNNCDHFCLATCLFIFSKEYLSQNYIHWFSLYKGCILKIVGCLNSMQAFEIYFNVASNHLAQSRGMQNNMVCGW